MQKNKSIFAGIVVLSIITAFVKDSRSAPYSLTTGYFKTSLGGCHGTVNAINGYFKSVGTFSAALFTNLGNSGVALYTASNCLNRAYFYSN